MFVRSEDRRARRLTPPKVRYADRRTADASALITPPWPAKEGSQLNEDAMNRIACLTIAALSFCASAAQAQPVEQGGATAQEIVAWLQGQGLDAAVRQDAAQPSVASGANGVSWDLNGFDCQAARCASWQFSAAFLLPDVTDEAIARWNVERRYLKAFRIQTDEGPAAVAQYDVLITPGVTWEGMTEHMRLFASVAPLFAVDMGAVVEE